MEESLCFQKHPNCRLTIEHLRFIGDYTVSDWRRIVADLGVEDYMIKAVDEDAVNRKYYNDSREVAYQGFLKWKNKDPLRASFCLLKEVLAKAQRNDIKQHLMEKFEFSAQTKHQKTKSNGFNTVNYFVGRKKEIKCIMDFCCSDVEHKFLLLYGLPGVGKSELLRHCINEIRKTHPNLDVIKPLLPSNEGEGKWGLEDLASCILIELLPEQCPINHRVATLHTALGSIDKVTVLILEISGIVFKDTTMPIFWSFLEGFLRSDNKNLKIIATSNKLPDINQMQHINAIEIHLKGLEKQDGIDLLKLMNPTLSQLHCEQINNICESHPFILRKLGAHIKNITLSSKEVDELIESLESKKNLEVLQPLISRTVLKRDMKICFDELEMNEKETLVKLCGFNEVIPIDALLSVFGDVCYNHCQHLYTSHCIIEKSSTGKYFKMNMLTRSFICEYSQSDFKLKNLLDESKKSIIHYYTNLLRDLDELFFWPADLNKKEHVRQLIQEQKCKSCSSESKCTCSIPKAVTAIFQKRKTMIMKALNQGLSSELLEEVVNTCSKTVHFLRNVLCYEDLHMLFDEVFNHLSKSKDQLQMAITMANLVFIKIYHKVTSEKDENIAYLTKSINHLKSNTHIHGVADVLAQCYCNRGYLRGFYSSQYCKGIADVKKAREISSKLRNTNRTKIFELSLYGYMSAIYYRQQKFKTSIEEREHQLVGYRKYLGVHPYTAKSLNYQGQAYAKIKNYDQAISCCFIAHQMYRKLYGEGFQTMRVLSTFGKVYLQAGNYGNGMKMLAYALKVGENALGEHDSTAWCYEQLAEAKKEQGLTEESEQLQAKAASIRHQFAIKSQVSNRRTYSLQISREDIVTCHFSLSDDDDDALDCNYLSCIILCMIFALLWKCFELYIYGCSCPFRIM